MLSGQDSIHVHRVGFHLIVRLNQSYERGTYGLQISIRFSFRGVHLRIRSF